MNEVTILPGRALAGPGAPDGSGDPGKDKPRQEKPSAEKPGSGGTTKESAPAVSVIIPVYNRFTMLRQAVASVLYQNFRDFELIIVDDGSTDGTAHIGARGLQTDAAGSRGATEIASAVTQTDAAARSDRAGGPRNTPQTTFQPVPPKSFKFLQIEHTGMPGAVRNRGVEASRGEFIAFLDSDDLWMPRKLERQILCMRIPGAPGISHTRELWLRNGKIVSQASQKHKRSGRLFHDSLLKCIIGPSTVMMKRKLFLDAGGFREDIEIAEDYELWLKITARSDVAFLDQPLTVKRGGHEDQLTAKYGQIEIFRIEALAGLLDNGFFNDEDRILAAAELSRKCAIYANGARKRGKIDEALDYESRSRKYAEI